MEENTIGPQDFVSMVKRRKWSLMIPFVCVLIIAGLTAWLLPAIYKSTATILIEQREIPSEYVVSSQTVYAEQRMQNIRQRILTSKQLLELIKRFDLYKKEKGKLTTDEILEKMRDQISLEPISVKVRGRAGAATIAFTLSFEGKEPSKVQQVTDQLVTVFLKEDLAERTRQASSTHEFLQAEKDKLKETLNALEERLAEFKKKNAQSLPDLFQYNMQSLSDLKKEIEATKDELRSLNEKKAEMEAELANIPATIDLGPSVQDRVDQNKKRLAVLEIELINLRTKYSDLYPDVRKVKQEIKDLTLSIEEQSRNKDTMATEPSEAMRNPVYITLSSKLSGLKSDITYAESQIKDLRKAARDFEKRLAASPDVEATYNELVNERNNLTTKYKEMQAKMMEAKVAQALESEQKGERFTLIESATYPEKPFKPNRLAIFLIGLAMAIGAGFGTVAIAEFADESIRDAATIERISGFPVLTTVPRIMTRDDKTKKLRLKLIWLITFVVLLIILVALFHFYVMDLYVFVSKVLRKLTWLRG